MKNFDVHTERARENPYITLNRICLNHSIRLVEVGEKNNMGFILYDEINNTLYMSAVHSIECVYLLIDNLKLYFKDKECFD